MSRFPRSAIQKSCQKAIKAKVAAKRGAALEELVCQLFGSVPGVMPPVRNVVDFAEGGEIDVFFGNKNVQNGLWFLPISILVECKNWKGKVGSEEMRVFIDRLRERACKAGIMVAAHGITGDNNSLKSARRHISRALEEGTHVLVVSLDELGELKSAKEVVKLLLDKWTRLHAFLSSI